MLQGDIMKRRTVLAGAVVAALATSAGAQTAGDWVLGNYRGGDYWYPGLIEAVNGRQVTIRYDDGDRETVSLDAVRPYDWMIGMRIECNFQGLGTWYPGTISALAGESIGIAYDDGDSETTRTGRCRS